MTTLAIHGAAGQMGRRLVALATDDARFEVVGAIEYAGHDAMGTDAGLLAHGSAIGVPLTETIAVRPDVIIDFWTPTGTRLGIASALEDGSGLVVGTTGLQAQDHASIDAAGERIAVLQAPNMSLKGVSDINKINFCAPKCIPRPRANECISLIFAAGIFPGPPFACLG